MKKPAAKTKPVAYPALITGIGALLEESRRAVVRAANCFMTATYWEVGRRIVEFEQGGKRRAEYGEELLERLSRDLTKRHGRGFGVDNLERFRQFFLRFPASNISATLSRKSSDSAESVILQTLQNRIPAFSQFPRQRCGNSPSPNGSNSSTPSPPASRSRGRTT
jgi:hypothetical protein